MRPVGHARSRPVPSAPTGDGVGRRRDEGVVGGVEVLPFGLLVFVVGILIVANAWAVVDAKLAVDSAAREAGRAYAEAPDAESARVAAQEAGRTAVAGAGRDPARLRLRDDGAPFERCAVVEHEATYRLPGVTIPIVGGWGSGVTVHGRHRDVIDPFASGLEGDGECNT